MTKKFNITGTCYAEDHYMADVSSKLKKIKEMVDYGDYFIINRPRQYGKTTTLNTISYILNASNDYLAFKISFEGIGDIVFEDEKLFASTFFKLLSRRSEIKYPKLMKWLAERALTIQSFDDLSSAIIELVKKAKKKVVVLIDEVDKSSNNQLFISFLAMLRNLYLDKKTTPTFHSVILAGVHDVKSLKAKIRPDEEQKFNSPWNIAAEFKVDMNLQPFEIKTMLDDYVTEKAVKMDTAAMAEDLFYYTSGYPFLVSKLCKMIDEDVLLTKEIKEWTAEDLEWQVKQLVLEQNTNFESVTKNLENYPDLYQIVYGMLIDGEYQDYNLNDPIINLGIIFGIFKNGRGIRIHNKIYEELIYHYMTSKAKTNFLFSHYTSNKNFKLANNVLNMELILQKFQAFMHEQYSKHDRDFLERHSRLVYLAFMKPILNGYGYDFKEAQISQERRLDVTITFYQYKYVAELKIWRGQALHEEGLDQLSDYLDRLKLTEGYLIIFDHKEIKTWESKWIEHKGKRVFAIWV
ncbi:MAG: AAA family ATPase [Saprospiraceae bacterium]|nr:AAA family ATPase [Saprospiraceae bacterium]